MSEPGFRVFKFDRRSSDRGKVHQGGCATVMYVQHASCKSKLTP